MDAMRAEIPSLVSTPLRSYGRIYVIGALIGMAVVVCSGAAALLAWGVMLGLRTMEPYEKVAAEVQGRQATLNRCRGYLAEAERALAQREIGVGSLRAPIETLNILQRELPQDAWIHSLRVSQGRLELTLITMSEELSVGIAARLTKSARIFNANVQSMERSQNEGGTLYIIRLTASVRG